MQGRPRVLFVSHDASRTGSPLVLLTLQRWLQSNADIDIRTLLLEGGPMEADFAAVGHVHRFDEINLVSRRSGALGRLTTRLGTMPRGIDNTARAFAKLESRTRAAILATQIDSVG